MRIKSCFRWFVPLCAFVVSSCMAPIIPSLPPAPLVHRSDSLNVAANFGPHGVIAYGGYGMDRTTSALFAINYADSNFSFAGRKALSFEGAIGQYYADNTIRAETYAGVGFSSVQISNSSSFFTESPPPLGDYSIGQFFIQGSTALSTRTAFLAQLGLSARLSYHHILNFRAQDPVVNPPENFTSHSRSQFVVNLSAFTRLGWSKFGFEVGLGLSVPLKIDSPYTRVGFFPMSIGIYSQL